MRSDAPALLSVFDVEPRFIGGTETYARELSLQLQSHGWRSVLCFASVPAAEVRHFLDLPNVSFELVDFVHGSKLGILSQLAKVIRRQQPRIAHFHYTDFLSPYPWLARLLAVGRVFFTDHSSRPANHLTRRASFPKRCLARLINWPMYRVISVSHYGYRCFTARDLLPPSRCEMIYNGVDLSRVVESPQRAAAFRRRFSVPDGRAVILQIGWIIPEKGVLDLLSAARIVLARNPDTHFVIAGDGVCREEYTRTAKELGLGDHVTWTGLLEDPFGAGVYDVADIVCQVSRWEEVFGWVIAEAMAYQKPVIATRVGGIPELVTHEDSGFLIERGDAEALAERILCLLGDPARRRSMGNFGRAMVDRNFDLRKNVARLLESYGIGQA